MSLEAFEAHEKRHGVAHSGLGVKIPASGLILRPWGFIGLAEALPSAVRHGTSALFDLPSLLRRRRARPASVFATPDDLRETYDVAVLGGGVRGLAIARACASEGASVALFAAGEIAAAADERAWPVVRAAHVDRLRAASDETAVQHLGRLAAGLPTAAVIDPTGCATLASGFGAVEQLEEAAKRLKADGVQAWMIPAREVAALSPPLFADDLGPALYEPGAVVVDVDALALGLAEDAAALGAHLFPHAPAGAIERQGAVANGVEVMGRSVGAGAIALAGDLSAIRLVREGRGRLSLTRDERVILVTAAGAPDTGPALTIDDLLISRDRAGAVTLSGPAGTDALARRVVALAPTLGGLALAEEEPVTIWTGVDGLPQVGAAEIERLWLALGYGRDGLSLGLLAAEHLAALMAGRRGLRPLEPFAPTRRPAIRTLEAAR